MLLYMQAYVNSLVALGTQRFNSALSKIQVRLQEWKTPMNTLLMFGYCVGERPIKWLFPLN